MLNVSAGSVTVAPGTFDAGEPVVVLLPVPSAVELTVALFARPVVVTVTESPLFAFTQVFLRVRVADTRAFV